MSEDRFQKAIDMATLGDPSGGIRFLWPDMLDDEVRDQALFAVAFCFEKSENYATAQYLFDEVVARHPNFELAATHLETCRGVCVEKGLIEDFADIGHRQCSGCALRYRTEYMLCPYCGTVKDEARKYFEEPGEPVEEVPGWKDPSLMDSLEDMGRDAADLIQEFVESDLVQDLSKKVVSASIATGKKAKELAGHEKVKVAGEKSKELGKGVFEKAEKLSENPTIQDIAHKIEDVGNAASEKVKEMLTPEKKKAMKEKAEEVGKTIVDSMRKVLDPPKKGK